MQKKENNYAFIDSQNVNLAIRGLGWKLDWKRFRVYLREKYAVTKAFLFIGYVPGNERLYSYLQDAGFLCVFKPTLEYKFAHYDKAVIVTGDGDFYCLAKYLIEQQKLEGLLIPNRFSFSALLRFHIFKSFLRYMNDLRERLAYKEKKRPHEDRTS